MPLSALRHVKVDHCVSLAIMPLLLATLADGLHSPARADGNEAVAHEHQLTLNTEGRMEHLQAIGKPSTYTCPECHGDLWEMLDSPPHADRLGGIGLRAGDADRAENERAQERLSTSDHFPCAWTWTWT